MATEETKPVEREAQWELGYPVPAGYRIVVYCGTCGRNRPENPMNPAPDECDIVRSVRAGKESHNPGESTCYKLEALKGSR